MNIQNRSILFHLYIKCIRNIHLEFSLRDIIHIKGFWLTITRLLGTSYIKWHHALARALF